MGEMWEEVIKLSSFSHPKEPQKLHANGGQPDLEEFGSDGRIINYRSLHNFPPYSLILFS